MSLILCVLPVVYLLSYLLSRLYVQSQPRNCLESKGRLELFIPTTGTICCLQIICSYFNAHIVTFFTVK